MEKDELQELGEAIRIRREKLAALVAEGRDPFKVVKFDKNAESADIKEKYSEYEGKEVKIAGRMIAKRVMGKASFAKILDFGGSIQIYVSRDDLGAEMCDNPVILNLHYFKRDSYISVICQASKLQWKTEKQMRLPT